jgi:DNA-binding response OmpR family regulator
LRPIVDDMLQKPFRIDELQERVTNLSGLTGRRPDPTTERDLSRS